MRRRRTHEPWKGALAGLAGGLAGAWVMTHAHTAWSKAEEKLRSSSNGDDGQDQGEENSGDEPATVKAASAVSKNVFRHELSDEEKPLAGQVMHYGFGASMGALYGAACELDERAATAMGLPFGTVLWLTADEVAVPALKLSTPPTEHPPSTHARALVAHLVYGMTTDLVRRAVRHSM